MPRTTCRSAAALVAVALAAGLTGCRGGSSGVAASGTAAGDIPTTTTAPAERTTTSRKPATTGRSTSTSTGSRASTTSATGAGRPQVVVPKQGDQVVAVFVVTGASLDEPAVTKAIARLKALGYPAYSGGDTGCSRGAKEALPQLGQYSISVEFATSSEAQRFAALYGDVVGIATVTVYCAD